MNFSSRDKHFYYFAQHPGGAKIFLLFKLKYFAFKWKCQAWWCESSRPHGCVHVKTLNRLDDFHDKPFVFFSSEIVVNWFITDAPPIPSIYVCASSVDFRKFFSSPSISLQYIGIFTSLQYYFTHREYSFFFLHSHVIWLAYKQNLIATCSEIPVMALCVYSSKIVKFSYLHISHSWK